MQSETTEVLAARYGARYRSLATVTVMLGTISAVLTTTTVNVAIPDIMGAFGIGQDRAQWLATGALHFLGRMVYAQAYTMGFRDAFLITCVVFTLGLVPAWIMGRGAQVARRALPLKA